MAEHVTVEHGGHIRIDTRGWLAQRVGAEHTELTAALGDWGHLDQATGYPSRDWMTRAELWCTAREYLVSEGFPVTHDHPWLSREVSILLASAGEIGPIAIVSIDGSRPTIYADITTDEGYWYQVDSVDIVCAGGHRWTWHGRDLVGTDGHTSTVTQMFGDHPGSPFTPCPECLAYDNDETDTPCPNPGADVIICPDCGRRCDLTLTPVPTVPQLRPYTVHVSEAIEYQGWVLATDVNDADDEARRLLDDGGTATGRGHLDIVHLDREVMANDAAEVCWQCRTDPRQPNPTCLHLAPGMADGVTRRPRPAVRFDAAAVRAWLDSPSAEYPDGTNAEALGIDPDGFGRGLGGFLSTVENLLHAWPPGLVRRADVEDVLMWLIPDDEVLDQGAVITVDLVNGVRLATLHQDIKDFADRDARGIAAALPALAHVAAQASLIVDAFQRQNPAYQPPGSTCGA